jgi:high-affinity iron transporter
MGAAFLIVLREGLEISLVLAIIGAYLVKVGRSEFLRPMWLGAAAAAVLCVIFGIIFNATVGDFTGKPEQAIEGTLAIVAAVVLTGMIFWMRKHSRGMSGELHGKIDAALDRSGKALAFVSFVAVAREGFETVLFLLSAETGSSSGSSVVIGGLIGLAISAVLGYLFYTGSYKIDLKKFFSITGGLLILFAAGLFAKAFHEFRELLEIESSLIAKPVWDITSGPLAEGSTTHDFLQGFFGWSASPERIRVLAYFAYLIPVTWMFFRRAPAVKVASPSPVAENAATSV